MNVSARPPVVPAENTDLTALVNQWLLAFERALDAADEDALAKLFVEDSHWRDVLAYTWHLTPRLGNRAIADGLLARQPVVKAHDFAVSEERTPPHMVMRLGRECIEAIYRFTTHVGGGEGEGRGWLIVSV